MILGVSIFNQPINSPSRPQTVNSPVYTNAIFAKPEIKAPEPLIAKPKTCNVNNVANLMINIIDAKDAYTGKHSRAVQKYSVKLAKSMGLPQDVVDSISLGAAFHDIGKIGAPDEDLNCNGPLSPEQFARMKQHPEIGSEILRGMPEFKGVVSDIVKHHHANWDGSGYPNNLAGQNIPLGARIVSIADSYHAMTSDRPYRKGMPKAEAINRLQEGAGKQWDPNLVEKFIKIL